MGDTVSEVPSLEDLIQQVNDSYISSIKQVVTKIIEVASDPLATPQDLEKAIEIDPPLAAKVLRSAKSAFYHHPTEPTDLTEAIIWIGFETVTEMAMHHKVSELFRQAEPITVYSRIGLWKHSISVAHCLKFIYRREFEERGKDAYFAGLLSNIGVIIEDQFLHQHFRRVLEYAVRIQQDLTDMEQHLLGYTHAEIGSALFMNWGFPAELSAAIGSKYHPEQVHPRYARLTQSLLVADAVCQKVGFRYADVQPFDKERFENHKQSLGLHPKSLELIMEDVHNEMRVLESEGWFRL